MKQALKELWIFISTLWLLICHTKPYRQESRQKACELYKEYIWTWCKEDRTWCGLCQAAKLFEYDREVYFEELRQKVNNDQTLMGYVEILFTMGGFVVNGAEISREELEDRIKTAKSYVSLIIVVILIMVSLLCLKYT